MPSGSVSRCSIYSKVEVTFAPLHPPEVLQVWLPRERAVDPELDTHREA